MRKIIFRADGNSTIGLGHLYRVYALIEMYQKNYDCILLCKASSADIIPTTYTTHLIPESVVLSEEPEWISRHFDANKYTIIADGYEFNSMWQKALKSFKFQLIYIDDLCQEEMYADTIINHALGICKADYHAQTYTTFALGTKYAILRPKFLEEAKKSRFIENFHSVFVCFGGADPLKLTVKSVKALLNLSAIKNIHVVLGAAYSHPEIFELANKFDHLKVYQNISETDLIKVMKSSDFAISPASNILYELCAVKMPILSGYYVENQKKLYEGCLAHHLIYGMGNIEKYVENDFEKHIQNFLVLKNKQAYVIAQSQLFDANIKERFLNLLQQITFRKATNYDVSLIFNWANNAVTRANSYQSEPITFETHQNWFEKKLNDPKSYIYIAELEGKPCGMIRYELSDDHTVVGILLDENFRGKGLAAPMLMESAKLYFEISSKSILAYIKENNIASIKTFEKAGYEFLKKEVVSESPSVVYQLKKTDV